MKYILLFGLLFSAQVWAFGDQRDVTDIPPLKNPVQVSVGVYHTCVIDEGQVKCWGYHMDDQNPAPDFKNPIQVSAGGNHTCVLDAEGVKCWGSIGTEEEMVVPPLKSPTQISSGNSYTCALDIEGVKCWGSDSYGQTKVPPLKKPFQVSARSSYACALDAEGVKCWGDTSGGISEIPPLKNPKLLSVGAYHACVLDEEGVKCWGKNEFGQTNVPPLKNPVQVSVGYNYTCALDAEGVKCWGVKDKDQVFTPPMTSVTQISAGDDHACALTVEGLKCWGGVSRDFNIFDLLELVAETAPASRAEYITAVHAYIHSEDLNTSTQYLEYLLVSPVIESVDSAFYTEELIPLFMREKAWLLRLLNYDVKDVSGQNVPDISKNRTLAIVSIKSALSVGLGFLGQDMQPQLQNTIRNAGIAFAEPMNNQRILDLLKQVDSLSAEKQKLKSSPKSTFLVDTLELAANYLREKVK